MAKPKTSKAPTPPTRPPPAKKLLRPKKIPARRQVLIGEQESAFQPKEKLQTSGYAHPVRHQDCGLATRRPGSGSSCHRLYCLASCCPVPWLNSFVNCGSLIRFPTRLPRGE